MSFLKRRIPLRDPRSQQREDELKRMVRERLDQAEERVALVESKVRVYSAEGRHPT